MLSPRPPHPADEGVDEKRESLEEKLEEALDKTLVPEIGLWMVGGEEEEMVRVVLGTLWGRARVIVLGCRGKHIVC